MSIDTLLSTGLGTLTDQLFVYASRNCAGLDCVDLAGRADGIIFTQRDRALLAQAREKGYSGPVLLDPGAYEKQEGPASVVVQTLGGQRDSVTIQEQVKVHAYLSDSGFVSTGDPQVLAAVIAEGVEFCRDAAAANHQAPAFIVLPIGSSWLTSVADRKQLIDQARGAGFPIALVLCGRYDVLNSRNAVEGLMDVVTSVPDIFMLRVDLSGIGAMSLGALCAAIGVGTATRHCMPSFMAKRGPTSRDQSPSTLWTPGGAFFRGSKFEHARNHQGMLRCPCPVCDGRDLGRFVDAPWQAESREHSVCGWYGIAQTMMQSGSSRSDAWKNICRMDLDELRLLRRTTRVDFDTPRGIQHWFDAL
jgi:hypothetical protein